MYIPNNRCSIEQATTKANVYGEQQKSGISFSERCCVISLFVEDQRTEFRTALTATGGSSSEEVQESIILLSPKTRAGIHDIVTVSGSKFKISKTEPKFDNSGKLDHIRAHLTSWKGG